MCCEARALNSLIFTTINQPFLRSWEYIWIQLTETAVSAKLIKSQTQKVEDILSVSWDLFASKHILF